MTTRFRVPKIILAMSAALTVCTTAGAVSMVFPPSKDNTLYEDAEGDVSNGQGIFLFAGRTGPNDGVNLRRGLIAFNLAVIPIDSVVTGVTFMMFLSKSSPTPGAEAISLHVAARDWGEGASNAGNPGGFGTTAQTGDATWRNNFFNTGTWTTAGGDFRSTASATTSVSAENQNYSWASAPLIADVQNWVNNPASNFGWFIRGDEVTERSAQRFNTGENTFNPPRLTVTYDIIPEPSSLALFMAVALLLLNRRNFLARLAVR